MSFFHPYFFWFLLALVPVLFLFLYSVRVPQTAIDSLFLIKRLMRKKKIRTSRSTGRQSFKLLILQILFVCLAVLSLASPVIIRNLHRNDLVILLDTSMSMNTRYDKKTRIESAKQKAYEVLASLSPQSQAIIASFDTKVTLHTPATNEIDLLQASIKEIEATPIAGQLTQEHLSLLESSVISALDDPKIIVLTDYIPDELANNENCQFYVFSKSDGNVGITGINISHQADNTGVLSATILSDSYKALYIPVRLYDGEQLIDQQTTVFERPVEKNVQFVIDLSTWETQTARIELDIIDALKDDNTAQIMIPKPISVRIDGSLPHLEKAIRSYEFTNITDSSDADLIASVNQPGGGTNNAHLIVNPTRGNNVISVGDRIQIDTQINVLQPAHPIMRDVSFYGITVPSVYDQQLPDNAVILAVSNNIPVLYCFENESKRTVVINFNPENTTFPQRISFPVLIANCIEWITNKSIYFPARTFERSKPGQNIMFSVPQQDDVTQNFFLKNWVIIGAIGVLLIEGFSFYGTKRGGRQ